MDKTLLNAFRPPQTKNSFFISFEGIEGAGKSTVITKAKEFLEKEGYQVLLCREPGGTVFGENLRKSILESKTPIHPMAEAMLFASSRAQLLTEVILKHLEKEKMAVLCDRYIDSSIAYQGEGRNLGTETILQIHSHAPLTTVPHRTYYVAISLETSMHRQEKRNAQKDYFESEKEQFYRTLIRGYEKASQLFPQRITVINGEQNEERVANDVIDDLRRLVHGQA